MVLMKKPSVIDAPSGGAPEQAQDGISWIQKVTAMKLGFWLRI